MSIKNLLFNEYLTNTQNVGSIIAGSRSLGCTQWCWRLNSYWHDRQRGRNSQIHDSFREFHEVRVFIMYPMEASARRNRSSILISHTQIAQSLSGGKIYTVDIVDTTITLRIAVADNDPIDLLALRETFLGTLDTAREKMNAWGGTTYLHPSDDPFVSDQTLYTKCNIVLESESKYRRSRQRLKYGRVLLVLRALNTFLFNGHRPNAAVAAISDNGLLIGQASVEPNRGLEWAGLRNWNASSQVV